MCPLGGHVDNVLCWSEVLQQTLPNSSQCLHEWKFQEGNRRLLFFFKWKLRLKLFKMKTRI